VQTLRLSGRGIGRTHVRRPVTTGVAVVALVTPVVTATVVVARVTVLTLVATTVVPALVPAAVVPPLGPATVIATLVAATVVPTLVPATVVPTRTTVIALVTPVIATLVATTVVPAGSPVITLETPVVATLISATVVASGGAGAPTLGATVATVGTSVATVETALAAFAVPSAPGGAVVAVVATSGSGRSAIGAGGCRALGRLLRRGPTRLLGRAGVLGAHVSSFFVSDRRHAPGIRRGAEMNEPWSRLRCRGDPGGVPGRRRVPAQGRGDAPRRVVNGRHGP